MKKESQTNQLLSSIIAGLVLGVIGVLAYITPMAVLVFSGNLERYVATGIGITLFSGAVIGVVMALRSSFVGAIGLPVPEEMAILGVIAGSIDKSMPASGTPEELFLTIVAAIALSSLLTGAFLLTLGQLKFGELIRFLPYPVVGGFLAGLGCLLSQGSIKVMTDISLSFTELPHLFQGDVLLRWFPGLVLAVVLLIISRRYSHFLILPASFFAATGLFYLVLFFTHTPVAVASSQGWLLGPFPEGSLWKPLSFSALMGANWSVVFDQLGTMMTLMAITALSLLLVSSGLELATERELDLNRELQGTGIANILSGLGGGMVGSHAVTTVLVHKMGVRSRLVGIFAAAVYVAVLLFGLYLLSFFPKPVLGALLLFIGLDLLTQWVYDSFFKLPRNDYLIVILIMMIIATVGFVQGVAVGLVVAIILFVINYSKISVTKYSLSGVNYLSHVQRPENQERMLRENGEQTYIMQLQGLIFFGTANKLLSQIRQRLGNPNLATLRFVVLDFRLVSGIDSSAVLSFVKIKLLASQEQISLLFTNLSGEMEKQLRIGGVLNGSETCQVFPDLDRGVEWCENQIIENSKYRRQRSLPLAMQLKTFWDNNDQVSTFMSYLEKVQLGAGDYLFRQGTNPESLYFIESGQVSTIVENEGTTSQRVQTLGGGTIVGEIAFYTKSPYETSAIADKSSKLYRLGTDALEKMQSENPQVAAVFSGLTNSRLAERLANAQKEIAHLLR